ISARRTNLDPVLELFNSPNQTFRYRFYDLNAKISLQLNPKNKIYISGFTGDDDLRIRDQALNANFRVNNQSQLRWGNTTGTINWFSILKQDLTASTTLTYTNYNSRLGDATTRTPTNGEALNISSSFSSGINDLTLKSNFTKNTRTNRQQDFGIFVSRRVFTPNVFSAQNVSTTPDTINTQRFGTFEAGVFYGEKWTLTPRVKLTYGLRYTLLGVEGKTYQMLEPRASVAYQWNENNIFKLALDRTTQSVNLLQSSGFGLSTDLYIPATAMLRPQISNQISLGYETSLHQRQLNLTVESYLKRQEHLLNFREGVSLFFIGDDPKAFDWERNLAAGQGLLYGFEIGLRKPHGKLTGWLGYTWAKAIVRFAELNNGLPFYPFQDRRHDVSGVASYKIGRRLQLSANWVLTTGHPITLPLGYYFAGFNPAALSPVNYYGSRNFSRMPTYHRLDVSLEIFPKRIKKWSGTWEFGLFNAYNRRNAFNAYVQIANNREGSTLDVAYSYLLPMIPSITYHFKF
ncbi:MAG: TonB-dependent receptor plug domain-containing protein, partial [Runella sp.]